MGAKSGRVHVRGDLGAGGADPPHEVDATKGVTERIFQQLVKDIQAMFAGFLVLVVAIRVRGC